MSGPQHYAEAERLLVRAESVTGTDVDERRAYLLEMAKVHAALAHTAAVIDASENSGSGQWMGVLR